MTMTDGMSSEEPKALPPAHDKEMARRFLAGLDPNATRFTFQFFSDCGDRRAQIFHGTFDEVWPKVVVLNTPQSGVGAFVTISETDLKGRRSDNITRPRALFVDADGREQAEHCINVLNGCGVYPSMAVNSGRGCHFYFCTDVPLNQFSELQKQLIGKLGTDPAVKDLSRVMRLPGTLHLKDTDNPQLVKLLIPQDDHVQRWQLSDLISKLGLSPSPAAPEDNVAKGIESSSWFDTLPPELKDEVVDYALGSIAKNTKILELKADGGNNAEYFKLTTSVARSGAPNAEDIFVKYASKAKNADPEDELRQYFLRCRDSDLPENRGITVGTLLGLAQKSGANFDPWKRQAPPVPPIPPEKRTPLKGGTYSKTEALELINSHYLIGKSDQEIAIFRIKDDGLLAFTPPEQFKLDIANIFVRRGASAKPITVEKFWKESPQRHQRKIVFKPGGTTGPDEFNLWRGFEVEPRKGREKQRRLLRHIWQVICRRDKAKFKYIIRWLAWAVQNPDKFPGTIIVLKSRKQGTGKSTIGVVMLTIFGQHGALIDDSDRLLGRFNDWVEPVSFILADEILFAGDHKTADKLKSRVTANTFQIEHKGGAVRQIPNRLHLMMTTNHDHAVAAGVGDRRLVVYDVSDEHASDKTWFDPLYHDLENGGFSEFLYLLSTVRLT